MGGVFRCEVNGILGAQMSDMPLLPRGDELEGRVAIVTGGGRGLGRHHALFLASRGAKVVVNDIGGDLEGSGADVNAAEGVVAEIRAQGGDAIPNFSNVADWAAGEGLIRTAIEAFGDLHVLVNNAGIVRDISLPEMSESQLDSVLDVHVKGHFVLLRHAAHYWSQQHDAGRSVRASVINTTSRSGLYPARPNSLWKAERGRGQSNYAASKAAIAAMTLALAAELSGFNIRVNAIAPVARTRMTQSMEHLSNEAESSSSEFDPFDGGNVSPVVGWLGTSDCAATGQVYFVFGGTVQPMVGWTRRGGLRQDGRWTIDLLRQSADLLQVEQPAGDKGL
jgi:NAD(P)-dependent dehydrogenase (short-subunit alcohol dehydrogenase family)